MSDHPQHCLTNILFSLISRICNIYENENVKEKHFKELKKKYCQKSLIEVSKLKDKAIPLEVLRQPKTTKNEEIISFTITYNPSNPNFIPTTKLSFDNF